MKVCKNPDCPFAGQPQPFENFYKAKRMKDGLQSWCKTCQTTYNHLDKSKAKRREVTLRYSHTEAGQAKRQAYAQSETGQESLKKGFEKYRKSEKGHARDKALREKYPERVAARNAVNLAKQSRRLPYASDVTCVKCGKPADHYHHYLGYEPEHWLDVIPLCIDCHQEEHS